MSDSLHPWIYEYLVGIAEEYGSNLLATPRYTKRKKVQIIEFLTYSPDDEPTTIWATISDKQLTIPIKFSRDAVCTYSKLQGQRLTYFKTAIVSITQFKPFLSRIPSHSGRGMSTHSYLAIECDSVGLIGSIGEAMFGSPKGIDSHLDLKLWVEGLRKDGGAGNILKNRKLEQEAQRNEAMSTKQSIVAPINSTNKMLLDAKPADQEDKPKLPKIARFSNDRDANYPPDDIEQLLRQMKVFEPNDLNLSRNLNERTDDDSAAGSVPSSPERLVSEWAPTPQKIEAPSKTERRTLESPELKVGKHATPPSGMKDTAGSSLLESSAVSSSQPAAPTPAQRQKNVLPPSSPPPPSSSLVTSEAGMVSYRDHVIHRKVPRPTSPMAPRATNGPGEVLVPNSDTSMSHSQSQTQSQSQAGSQMEQKAGRKLEEPRTGSQSRDGDEHDADGRAGQEGGRVSERAKGGEEGREHDEEGWREPAFMERARDVEEKTSRKKLKGFSAELDEVRVGRGGHPWLSRASMAEVEARIAAALGKK